MSIDKAVCRAAIEAHLERFFERCSDLELLESAIRETARQSHEASERREATHRELDQPQGRIASYHNMTYRSLLDGNHVFYNRRTRTNEQITDDIFYHENKQFQWVLAETYELFEDMIESAYAYAQYLDPSFWKSSEIRQLAQTTSGNYAFEELSRLASDPKITGDAFAKLNRFRTKCSAISRIESRSPLHPNPKFMLALIELLRHVIVHNGGKVKDRRIFSERVFAKAGVLNNGNPPADLVSFTNALLQDWRNATVVLLLDAPTKDLVGGYVSRLGYLQNFLLAYPALIYSNALIPLTE